MNLIQIRLVQDSIESVAPIADKAAAMSTHCPLEGTRHHPCGLTYEEEQCQFRSLCSQMQDDSNRFLHGLGATFTSEFESAWTQTHILLATTMKEAATAHA